MMRTLRLIVPFALVLIGFPIFPGTLDAARSTAPRSPTQTPQTTAFPRSLPHLNVVLAGGTGTSRAALTSAITGVLAKRHRPTTPPGDTAAVRNPASSDAVARAVEFSTANRHVALLEVDSLRAWRKQTVSGALQADVGIVLVSGVQGATDDTRELRRLARLYGLSQVALFLDDMDRVANEAQAATTESELRNLLNGHGYEREANPIVRRSSARAATYTRWLQGVEDVLRFLDARVVLPPRETDKPFRMPIEEIFSIPTRGIIVQGRAASGRIRDRPSRTRRYHRAEYRAEAEFGRTNPMDTGGPRRRWPRTGSHHYYP